MKRFLILAAFMAIACEREETQETHTAQVSPAAAPVADSSPPASADVPGYTAAKAAYIKEFEAGTGTSTQRSALADLERRLKAIIGPIPGFNVAWKVSLDAIPMRGNEGGSQLDGLTGRLGDVTVIVSTPELVAEWTRFHNRSGDPMKELTTEDLLTQAFFEDRHVFPFADLMGKVDLPPDVFTAQLIAMGQDTGADAPDQLILGLIRGGRVYLMKAPLEQALPAIKECGNPVADSYRTCYADKSAALPGLADIGQQISDLAALVPERS